MATTATVGLTATLDITDFQRNAAAYMRTLQQMQQAANQTQTSTTSSFSQMGSLGGGVVPALNSIAMGFGAIGAAATAAAAIRPTPRAAPRMSAVTAAGRAWPAATSQARSAARVVVEPQTSGWRQPADFRLAVARAAVRVVVATRALLRLAAAD